MTQKTQYSVELRIEGESLSPQHVTLDLGLQPSLVRTQGERLGTRTFSKSMWAFGGRESSRDWPSLEMGLRHLLEELKPMRSIIEPYFRTCSVYWWCGSFQSEFGSTASLSPQLLEALAAFGAPVHLSCYFSDEAGD
jgi:hypothetical protein